MLQEGCEAEAKLLCAYADLSAATEADSRADCEATGNGNQCAYSPKVCIVLRCAALRDAAVLCCAMPLCVMLCVMCDVCVYMLYVYMCRSSRRANAATPRTPATPLTGPEEKRSLF